MNRSNTAQKPSTQSQSGTKPRYRAAAPLKRTDGQGQEKTFWTTLGAAFFNDNGSVTVDLNALPLPGPDGRCRIVLFPPDDDEQGQARRDDGPARGGRDAEDNPF